MTELSRAIFHEYQVRKGRRRKTAFLDFLLPALEREGIAARVDAKEASAFNRNIVIGDPDKAKLVVTAHYDTCAVMPVPNFITPKNVPLYLLYQLLVSGFLLVLSLFIGHVPMLLGLMEGFLPVLYLAALLACLGLLAFGPANPHTANDNTSGVIAVIETVLALPEELRDKVAFVLFDNEELGLLGSGEFAKRHPDVRKRAYVLNLDCVSDGDNMLVVLPKKCPAELETLLRQSFVEGEGKTVLIESAKGALYPSDQINFKLGVGIAALKRTKCGLLYMDRLHTARDTVFDETNIEYVKAALLRAAEHIS